MTHQTRIKLVHMLVLLVLSMITGYFSFHLAAGDNGWFVLKQKQAIYHNALERLSFLQKHRDQVAAKVTGLREESLDLDLLDENARNILGYAKPEEKVILNPNLKNSDL